MTFRMPAEWAPHDWTWIGFPTNPDEWPDAFDAARGQIAAFANALQAGGKGRAHWSIHLSRSLSRNWATYGCATPRRSPC